MPAKALLTDIEGTTSSISFVRDVLFPYAARALPTYIRDHTDSPAVAEHVAQVRRLMGPGTGGDQASLDDVIGQLLRWIDEDQKITPLKALEGMVWEHGYRSGEYRAHIYPDAHAALLEWHGAGIPMYVYSSGSIRAQQLFFGFSEYGDLTHLFAGYFDTTTGPKKHASSYRQIAASIGRPAHEILFVSDVLDELRAAREAGMQTRWMVRPEDTQVSAADIESSGITAARDFSEIML